MSVIGQIISAAWATVPAGYAPCDGRLLPVADHPDLFALIGTRYGGDGQTTFALPDLRGRTPIHRNGEYALGARGGVESVELTTEQMPPHRHAFYTAPVQGELEDPEGLALAIQEENLFLEDTARAPMDVESIAVAGASKPHTNMQPYLTIGYFIALKGEIAVDKYVGEIRAVALPFAPKGWLYCSGQLLPIAQHRALFELLGTRFGGDGRSTFGLPDLGGRVGIGAGEGPGLTPRAVGQRGGESQVKLTADELPAHLHRLMARPDGADLKEPGPNRVMGIAASAMYERSSTPEVSLHEDVLGTSGAGEAHDNRQPSLVMSYIMASEGHWPDP